MTKETGLHLEEADSDLTTEGPARVSVRTLAMVRAEQVRRTHSARPAHHDLADGRRGPREPQDRNRTNNLLPVTVDTRRMHVAERHKQHGFTVIPVMLSKLEPGIGQEKDSESTTSRARILELDFWRLRRDAHNKKCYFKRARGEGCRVQVRIGSYRSLMLFVQPARPGEATAPATDAAAESRPRWPLSVAVIDVTGAVKAVIGDVTAVNRGHDPCAGRDRHRAGSARRGRWSPAQSQGRRLGPCLLDLLRSPAHDTLACSTAVAIALCCSSLHTRLMRYPLPRCHGRVARLAPWKP